MGMHILIIYFGYGIDSIEKVQFGIILIILKSYIFKL